MLNSYCNSDLLGLEGVIVKKIENIDIYLKIYIELPIKTMHCPCCGAITSSVHDYRIQKIKDIPAFGKYVLLYLRKRCYRCECGKRFAEQNDFLPKYHRVTSRLISHILNKLR